MDCVTDPNLDLSEELILFHELGAEAIHGRIFVNEEPGVAPLRQIDTQSYRFKSILDFKLPRYCLIEIIRTLITLMCIDALCHSCESLTLGRIE